jgi:hypothetical protein
MRGEYPTAVTHVHYVAESKGVEKRGRAREMVLFGFRFPAMFLFEPCLESRNVSVRARCVDGVGCVRVPLLGLDLLEK